MVLVADGTVERHTMIFEWNHRTDTSAVQKAERTSPPLRVHNARKTGNPTPSLMILVEPSMSRKLQPAGCGPWNEAGLPVGEFGAPDRA